MNRDLLVLSRLQVQYYSKLSKGKQSVYSNKYVQQYPEFETFNRLLFFIPRGT